MNDPIDTPEDPPSRSEAPRPEHVRAVRLGHGANCSSIGSVIDTLFVTALAGGAIYAAVMAALAEEPVRTVGPDDAEERRPDEEAP